MHSAKAEVETSVAPGMRRARSYVTRRARIAPPSPRAIATASSFHPSSSNIIAPERITLPGFTLSCPAYLGAVPWVASKDRKSTRLNSSHSQISYAVFCLKKKKTDTVFSPSNTAPSTLTSTLTQHQMCNFFHFVRTVAYKTFTDPVVLHNRNV